MDNGDGGGVAGDGELQAGEADTAFTTGYDVITQAVAGQVLHLLYDIHGSTRALTDAAGAIAVNDNGTPGDTSDDAQQIFTYDAYGQAVGFEIAKALTALLYSGEFTNANTGGQYLRARYYDASVGRFNRVDPFAGSRSNPLTFHKYGYTHGNPVSGVDPNGLFSMPELMTTIGNMLSVANQVLRAVKIIDTAVDTIRMAFDILRLMQGDAINVIREHLDTILPAWSAAAPHHRTSNLFKEDFWQEAAQALLQNSTEILGRIQSSQGNKILTHLGKIKKRNFRWVIYMPSPAEAGLPNPMLRVRLPGLKILDRSVMIHFGPPGGGRLFGLGFENKRAWQSQFFRMDYHRPHAGNWVVQTENYDFNFHTPSFNRDPV